MFFIDHAEALGGAITIVEIKGPVNAETSPDFERYLTRLLEQNKTFIALDMGGVDYVSSAGIGLMLYMQKAIASRNGFLVVYRLPSEVRSLYEILGFDKVFTVTDTRDEALRIIEKQNELRESPAATPAGMGADAIPSQEIDAALAEDQPTSAPVVEIAEPSATNAPQARDDALSVGPPDRETDAAPPADALVNDAEVDFARSLIVECAKCRSLVRVRRSGSYLCPDCHASFTVEKDQTIIF
ncbi:MAG TPA: STAS domain-containing protein [Spirochaetota bacterium]|nr:STAS domain-containing protein [Spirochaetota bacterium]HNT11309.1 STAS domain-containing protein [Spirochaetota bacterium]HNV46858.1 STAS domain-containing protein [Spirochaetota bacterium]HOS41012.1 STAS domain-containing protein [Spirochaetota bacterium]HPI22392.1 STAS domain-containing protein [Spirochaetota bacterium]